MSLTSGNAPNSTNNASQTNTKELKGFNQDNEDLDSIDKIANTFDPNRYELWQVTVPKNFPESNLNDIPLVPRTTISIHVSNNLNSTYLCASSGTNFDSRAVFLPSKSKGSKFCCRKIDGTIRVTRSTASLRPNLNNCLKRPNPPSISEGLKERLKLIGWQGYCKRPKDETTTSDNSSVRKKRKKEKKQHKRKDNKKEKKKKKKKRQQ